MNRCAPFATVQHILLGLALLVSLMMPKLGSAQSGWWTGWIVDVSLPLSLHLGTDTAAQQLYSPLQSTQPLPVSTYRRAGDTLHLSAKSLALRLQLVYHPADSTWHGSVRQRALNCPIVFRPADTLLHLNRPQTPTPPYSFTEEPVTLQRTDRAGRTVVLSGTLALPRQALAGSRAPAVLLVSGSGQQDRDETLFHHKPFLVIAEELAARGIATLRYDDRGVGQSTGPVEDATTLDFADDAEALLRLLRRHPRIDRHRVGIVGHSEGATIASLIAARNRHVAAIVLLGGQGCSGRDVLLQQNRALYAEANPQALTTRLHIMQRCLDTLSAVAPADLTAAVRTIVADEQQHSGLPQTALDSVGLPKGFAFALAQQLNIPWMRTFVSLDPAQWMGRVRCPLLAMTGSLDRQVLATDNLPAIARLATHTTATTHQLNGLNHLFQHCTTGHTEEYLLIEETFAPEALEMMAQWLLNALR